jgi:hypothetical protein
MYVLTYDVTVRRLRASTVAVEKGKGKGKAIPVQAWTGPERSSKLKLPDFMTVGIRKW